MREMKDSGIPWIGEIPKDWNVKKLKFSCKLFGRIGFRGYTADDLVEESEGAITLSPTNMNNFNLDYSKCSYLSWDKYYESPEIMVEVGDVLLVKTASVGKCSYVDYLPKETTVNPQILVLKEHKDCSKFVTYLFHTSIGEAYIDTTKGGSTIYTISQEKIGNYEFAFPPFTEQQKIASFLDKKCAEVDEMIALQEQIIEELKAYKQSVITEAVTKGLNPDVPMKDSGIEWIGQIPEHWEVKPFKAYYKTTKGLNITKENLVERGVPVISYGQIHSKLNTGTSICDGLIRYVPETYLVSNPECLSKKFDMFFADTSEDREGAGNMAFIDTDTPIFAGYHTIIARPKEEVKTKYFAYLTKTDAWRTQIRNSVSGVKVFSISQKLINRAYIIIPTPTEQQSIADYLDKKCSEIDNLISIKLSKIDSLKEYKKSIIYEYVTGKKEVK